jgi:hypothetical protein
MCASTLKTLASAPSVSSGRTRSQRGNGDLEEAHTPRRSHERKGNRAIRIDTDLLSERTCLGQLHRNEAKIAAAITFAHETATARA